MATQVKTMTVKSDVALAETTTRLTDQVTFDIDSLPNGITYKGLKAVMSFADPIEWDTNSTYDALTVVWDQNSIASYVSKRPVPTGIEISNELYWMRMADGDAQVEMYRKEVQEFDGRITTAQNTADAAKSAAEKAQETADALKLTELVVFGDSWSDTSVEDAVWSGIVGDATGYNVHNYAINGASFSPGLESELQAFIKDGTYDKSKIACIIMVFGINDFHDGRTADDESVNIANFVRGVFATPGVPSNTPFYHFNNWEYGKPSGTGRDIYTQIKWFTTVFNAVSSQFPQYVPVQTFSWFNVKDFNSANWFHLTKSAQSTIFAKNILATVRGGEIEERVTFSYSPKVENLGTFIITMNITSDLMTEIDIMTSSAREQIDTTLTPSLPFPFLWALTLFYKKTSNADTNDWVAFEIKSGEGGVISSLKLQESADTTQNCISTFHGALNGSSIYQITE